MSDAKTAAAPAIKAGAIEARQHGETLLITFRGKRQDVTVEVPLAVFERWAMRQLRDSAFAA